MTVNILTQGYGSNVNGTATRVGTWSSTSATGPSYRQDNVTGYRFIAAGSGANSATWNFTGLSAGSSCVLAASWLSYSNRATNTPWQILDSDGSTVLASGALNQKNAATANFTALNDDATTANFQTMGTVTASGTSVTYTITDNANGFVIANAVYLSWTAPAGGGSFRGSSVARPSWTPISVYRINVSYD